MFYLIPYLALDNIIHKQIIKLTKKKKLLL